jgi:hypothetical protein
MRNRESVNIDPFKGKRKRPNHKRIQGQTSEVEAHTETKPTQLHGYLPWAKSRR